MRAADSATKRRETADFVRPAPLAPERLPQAAEPDFGLVSDGSDVGARISGGTETISSGGIATGDNLLAPIAAVIPVSMRIDSEHAVDAANDATSRSANNPTNKATDRSEHTVTGISAAVSPVVHPPRHALRLCGDRRGEKEADCNHTEHSHLVSLFFHVTPNSASRCWPLFGNK
jgi:hypothetical protein